eukprot:GFYU01011599.1.p1 GENE.GFYU01011599.1~~GFYU01011599.1.p1  ORF type:complete len:124 (-),score=8.66 GFYU01011599.1:87-458(-)
MYMSLSRCIVRPQLHSRSQRVLSSRHCRMYTQERDAAQTLRKVARERQTTDTTHTSSGTNSWNGGIADAYPKGNPADAKVMQESVKQAYKDYHRYMGYVWGGVMIVAAGTYGITRLTKTEEEK